MEIAFENTSTKLNKQQLEMLRLLNNPLSDADYSILKKQIVQMLAKRLDHEMERLEKKHGWTEDSYEAWGKNTTQRIKLSKYVCVI